MSFIVIETMVGAEYASIVTDHDGNNLVSTYGRKPKQKPPIASKAF